MYGSTEGTRFKYRPFALGYDDGDNVCVVCEGIISSADFRADVCPWCGIRLTATDRERDDLRHKLAAGTAKSRWKRMSAQEELLDYLW